MSSDYLIAARRDPIARLVPSARAWALDRVKDIWVASERSERALRCLGVVDSNSYLGSLVRVILEPSADLCPHPLAHSPGAL
jgi:hypothetical protein